MTPKTTSGSTFISLFYRSPRLMLGLSLLSGFSLLSSGLVLAQTNSLVDTGSPPPSQPVEAAPAPERPQQHKQKVTEILVEPTVPKKNRSAELFVPATPPAPPAAAKKPTQRSTTVTQKKPVRRASETAVSKPSSSNQKPASASTVNRPKKPALAAPELSLPDSATANKPAKLYVNPTQGESTLIQPTATHRFIDRTDYSIGATRRDGSAAPVIVTDRSTGCRTVSQNGQLLSGVCGTATPTQQTATRKTNNSRTVAQQSEVQPSDQQPNVKPSPQQIEERRAAIQSLAFTPEDIPKPTVGEPRLAERTLGEPRLAGVTRLPTSPALTRAAVKLASNKLMATGVPMPRRTPYSSPSSQGSGLVPVQPYSFPSSLPTLSQGWTNPSGSAYYNVTERPAGRPNTTGTNFMFPLAIPSVITSVFGWRIHPISGDYRFHGGTDIGAPEGTPVLAAVSGDVIAADFMGGYGLTVVIQHPDGKNLSLYGHLSEIFVQPGDRIEQGNVIGRVGSTGNSTGPHLHFEWRHLSDEGWITLDAGLNIEYALAQFVKSLEVAQATPTHRGF